MPDFMQGLAKGIEKSKSVVADAIEGVSKDMTINANAMTPEQRETDKRHHEYHIIAGSVSAIPYQELKHRMGYRRCSSETGKRYG